MADETALINVALGKLIGDSSQAGSREAEDVRGFIPATIEFLSKRQACQIVDPDDFPDEYLVWTGIVLAFMAGGNYGKPVSLQEREDAVAQLKIVAAGDWTPSTLAVDYF